MPSFNENDNDCDIRFDLNGKQIRQSADCLHSQSSVSVSFGNLLPMLEEAIVSRRLWVNDFADEQIKVSTDLYDVIQAFRYFNAE